MRKQSLKKVIIIAVVLVLAEQCFLWGGAFGVPDQYDRTWLGELKYKCARLHDTRTEIEVGKTAAEMDQDPQNPRRIIVIGGSGVAFDVDCALLEQEFPGCQAVNFGLYAALGSKVMLELCLPEIQEGDVVLFMPEQHEQTLSLYFDGRNMSEALDGTDRGAFAKLHLRRRLDIADQEALAEELPVLSFHKMQYCLSGAAPDPQTIYARSSFDAYGDVKAELIPANVMDGGWDTNTPITYDAASLPQDFIDYLNDYAGKVQHAGGQFLFAFCPANEAAVVMPTNASVALDQYATDLASRLQFSVLGDPHDAVMEKEWFYDTNYHLNAAGRQLYTRRLIRTLKAHLGITTPTDIPIPEMPEMASQGTAAAPEEADLATYDLSDMDLFTWTITDQGSAVLTGLSSQNETPAQSNFSSQDDSSSQDGTSSQGDTSSQDGSSSQNLPEEVIVPAYVSSNGTWYPVRRLQASLFANCTKLHKITIPDTVSVIEDNAFTGCTSLSSIILENTDPSSISIGQALLEGTSATLLVPQESLSSYLTDYNFSQYASRIRGYAQ